MSKCSLKAPKNNGKCWRQGFGDEAEQTLTCKNICFGSDEISSEELFRQQSEQVHYFFEITRDLYAHYKLESTKELTQDNKD